MAPESTKSKAPVILNGPSDWEIWESEFKGKAIAAHLWDHINPDQVAPLLPKPPKPKVTKFQRGENASERATSISDLRAGDRAIYQLEIQEYTQNQKEFENEDKAVQKLKDWVYESVTSHLRAIACKPDKDLSVWYKELKQQTGI